MTRLPAALILLLALAVAGTSASLARDIGAGRLGPLPVVLPHGNATGVVFLFSDRAGWGGDLEVDLPGYLRRLRASDRP
jgi:hypothetical protein